MYYTSLGTALNIRNDLSRPYQQNYHFYVASLPVFHLPQKEVVKHLIMSTISYNDKVTLSPPVPRIIDEIYDVSDILTAITAATTQITTRTPTTSISLGPLDHPLRDPEPPYVLTPPSLFLRSTSKLVPSA